MPKSKKHKIVLKKKTKKNNILIDIKNKVKSFKCNILNKTYYQYLKEGVTNTAIKSCIDKKCKLNFIIRIMGFSNNYTKNKSHPVNIELDFYKKFNIFNKNNILPHTPIYFKNFKCNFKEIFNLDEDKKEDDLETLELDYMDKIYFREIEKDLNIMLLEYCPYGNLKEFILKYKKNTSHLNNILFQILLTLVVSQYHIPGFRHNDLHYENIILGDYNINNINKYKNKKNLFIEYTIFGHKYYLPYIKYCVKMFDFDTSTSLKTKNNKIEDMLYLQGGVCNKINPVFDFHCCMNYALYILYKEEHKNKNSVSKEIINFYMDEIPDLYRGRDGKYLLFSRLTNFHTEYDYKNVNLIPKTIRVPYDILLSNPIFDKYKTLPENGIIIQKYNTKVPLFNEKQRQKRKDMFH